MFHKITNRCEASIDYAIQVMHQLKEEALSLLNQMPQNESRNGLEALVNYTITREK